MIKQKNIFDALNNIMQNKQKDYFNNLSESEQKDYNVFMIQRYLSMNRAWIQLVGQIDRYAFNCFNKEQYDKLMIDLIPSKQKVFLKYVKKNKEKLKDDIVISYIAKKYEIPLTQAAEYLRFMSTDNKKELLQSFGVDEKTIRKSIEKK